MAVKPTCLHEELIADSRVVDIVHRTCEYDGEYLEIGENILRRIKPSQVPRNVIKEISIKIMDKNRIISCGIDIGGRLGK